MSDLRVINRKVLAMRDWRDLNGDGIIDGAEMMFADEMLCT